MKEKQAKANGKNPEQQIQVIGYYYENGAELFEKKIMTYLRHF